MERRESKRLSVSLDAEIILNGNAYPVFIGNLSETGLHVFISLPLESTPAIEKDTSFKMIIHTESSGRLTLSCKKLWSSELLGSPLVREIGFLIVNPPKEYKNIYKNFFYKERTEITRRPIAVIGMACYYPGAPNVKHLWENILAQRREFRRIPDVRLPLDEYFDPDPTAIDKTYGTKAAVIDGFEFDWIKRGIPKSVVKSSDISHWLALETALKALEDAGYGNLRIPPDRSGVILGNTLTGEYSRAEAMRLRWPYVLKTLKAAAEDIGLSPDITAAMAVSMEAYYKSVFAPVTEDTLAGNLSNTIAGRICNFLDLKGGGYTVDGACSSSLIAVATAATALSHGNLDLAVVGGVDISLDTFEMIGFAKTKALTRDDMRVYDRRASGFIPGEGAGFVILKRLEDARADGDQVYAIIRGWAISSDGKGGLTAPKAKTQTLAIQRAYTGSGYKVTDLDFIEGHGTGTAAGDVAELESIAQAIGDGVHTFLRPCGITSLKSIIGHTKAASGIGGLIKAVLAVNRRIIPPTANCNEPNQIFENEARLIYPVLQGEMRAKTDSLKAGISGMGFGGINCHVTIESGDPPIAQLAPAISERQLLVSGQVTELFIISATSQTKLIESIKALQSSAKGMSIGELVDLAAQCARQVKKEVPWRAAVIAKTPEALLDNLQQLRNKLRESPPEKGEKYIGPHNDVFLSFGVRPCKIGFLFPGQGSQQLNMGRILVDRHEWAQTFCSNVSQWLIKETNRKDVITSIFRPLDRALRQTQINEWAAILQETEIAQPAICLVSLLWVKELQRLGIDPFAVGGHSLGELVAFHVAGALDEETLLKLAALRGRLMAAPREGRGGMASLSCSFERVSKILEKVEGYVVAANINGPWQVVISGEQRAVEDAVAIAQDQQFDSRILKVANAFHSKFVAEASEHLREKAQVPEVLGIPKVKLFTGMSGREVKQGINLRHHFADQIVSQVDFQSLVKNMALECDLLLGVGPGNATNSLAQAIVGVSGPPCLPIESKPGRDRDYTTFLAHYFVHGGNWKWYAPYENRLVRPFVLAQDRRFIINPCERPIKRVGVQSRNDLSLKPTILHKNLIENSGIDPQVFASYLDQGSSFLSSVTMTDLENMPLNIKPRKESAASKTSNFENADTEENFLAKNKEIPKDNEAIADLFLDLLEKRTGFPKETLTLEMRLLDHLNLDSIKSADLIGELAQKLHIGGEFNVFPYANATIREIVTAFETVLDGTKGHTTSVFKGKLQQRTTWVRNMVIKTIKKSLNKKTLKAEGWKGAKVLVYVEPPEHRYAFALENKLAALGAETIVKNFSEHTLEVNNMDEIDDLVAFLPSISCTEDIVKNDLLNMVNRLQKVADPTYNKNSRIRSVTFVQFGGGYFGVKPHVAGINQCSAVGFAASLHFERLELKTRVLDFDKRITAESLAEKVLLENNASAKFIVAGYDENLIRRVPISTLQEPANYSPRALNWNSDDVFLVTGGGKGISSECAFSLAQKTGIRMALVGSSPLPENIGDPACNNEIAETLKRYEDAGLEACYYQCDVVDPVAITKLIEKISISQGKITGVIHGSAANNPKGLQSTTADEAFIEVAPKVMGAINLCRALKDSPPRLFIGFTSIIGISGMIRNGWYAFSNEALHLILCRFKQEHPEVEIQSIAFSLWDEIGMGFRLGGTKFLTKMGIDAIPVKEGINRFLALVSYNPNASQVIVTARLPEMDTLMLRKYPIPSKARFLEDIVFYFPGVEVIARTRLTLVKDGYVRDHVWRGTYLFPTVFGLEAMAQAVAYATGENKFNVLRIENVQLERPIVVNPEKGTGIEIRAVVLERQTKQGDKRIQVGISTEQTDYSTDFFSATFVLVGEKNNLVEKIELPNKHIDIKTKYDLYNGKFLFHGPQFQRIRYIYYLDSEKCIFDSMKKVKYSNNIDSKWMLGDPFFRDSLLHSAQLPALRYIGLPVSIKKIYISDVRNSLDDFIICKTVINNIANDRVSCNTSSIDPNGNVVELIDGYILKIMEYHEDYPTPEELVSPEKRDEEILKSELKRGTKPFGYVAPQLAIATLSGYEQMTKGVRHGLEEPVLKKAVARCLGINEREDMRIVWLPSGKPAVEGAAFNGCDISLSNDLNMVLAIAGQGLQGCDLQSITERTRGKWTTLLGKKRMSLLDELISGSDSIDQAGTRIWAAIEAGAKAAGSKNIDLNIKWRERKSVFFGMTGSGNEKIVILTIPVSLTLGPERIVAVTVKPA